MDERTIVRGFALRIGAGVGAALLRALDSWAEAHAEWLELKEDARDWAAAHAALACAQDEVVRPQALLVADTVADALALDDFDTRLLRLIVAVDRLPRVAALARAWSEAGRDLPTLLGELAGAEANDAERRVRLSAPLTLGLVNFCANRAGIVDVDIRWTLERLLNRTVGHRAAAVEALVGRIDRARLALDDFAHVADADFLVRLLAGAAAARAEGVNVLIHGPPGTGKTELARTIAEAAGLSLHAVGEADDDGDEPNRYDRLAALRLAQRVLAGRGGAALLFDEMEDLIGDAQPSFGDWFAKREGSKLFVNRMLDANPVPVIWTSNTIGNVDPAILRRMSFVLKLDLPSPNAARRMLARVAAEEGVTAGPALDSLLDAAPETATVLRVAARAARLAGEADGGARSAAALVRALRDGPLPPPGCDAVDLDLFESDPPIATLVGQMAAGGVSEVSLLLSGTPGTGKTALAHHIARALDRPLMVRRASDLLSRWVGGTEANIAQSFADAREQGGVLLFDEVDSLLFDRSTARVSWEVGQVNEMLTWLDRHTLPVIAATNYGARLDPAALRRFLFKIELQPLGRERAVRAFERFFGLPAPAGGAELRGLTPADFALVARQRRIAPTDDGGELVARLKREAAARPEGGLPIGF